jgi:hypothetical protein
VHYLVVDSVASAAMAVALVMPVLVILETK